MIYTDIDALESVLSMIIRDMHPIDIRELASQLPDDFTEAINEFCTRFNLGSWFNDSMISHEVDLSDTLNRLADESEADLADELAHQAQVESDLQKANGWPTLA